MEGAVPIEVIQNLEFEILKFIRDVCEQNCLRYYLAYGTLIGAVRHQGFIPWDDDIDIHMPRNDYLQLLDILRKNPHPFYKVISIDTTPEFTQILPKMVDTRTELLQDVGFIERVPLGVYVDIWLLDGAGNSFEEAAETYRSAFILNRKWYRAVRKAFGPRDKIIVGLLKWVYHIPEKIKGISYWLIRFDRFCAQKQYDEYEYIGAFETGTPDASRNIWKREWFGDGTYLTFNGESFRSPANYDAILRPEYGDYMRLPPPEKRTSHHSYSLKILDKQILETQ